MREESRKCSEFDTSDLSSVQSESERLQAGDLQLRLWHRWSPLLSVEKGQKEQRLEFPPLHLLLKQNSKKPTKQHFCPKMTIRYAISLLLLQKGRSDLVKTDS